MMKMRQAAAMVSAIQQLPHHPWGAACENKICAFDALKPWADLTWLERYE